MLKNIFKSKNRNAIYIAEIGLNHNGNIDMAFEMIKKAAEAGADAVKFQTFIPEKMNSIYTKSLLEKGLEVNADLSIIDFLKKFIFTGEQYEELKKYSLKHGLIFFSSPFDIESVNLLEDINVLLYKIASSEVTNHKLIKRIADTGKPVILSTGISTEDEISMAVGLFKENSDAEIVLLHCVSLYPLKYENVNLNRIQSLKKKFNLEVGFSDHTGSIDAAVLSVCYGVRIFEKHFTIDTGYECADRAVSLTPEEFFFMINSVENAISMLGDGKIPFSDEESGTARSARRSIFARKHIPTGKIIESDDLMGLRPGVGIPLYNIDLICGMVSKVDIKKDYLIVITVI